MIDPIQRRDKKLLAIHRELQSLYRRAYVTIQLEQPTVWGWIRYYRVAEKIGAHRDREMLEAILKVIGTTRWSKTPEFKVWRGKRRKKRRFVNLEQPLRTIPASKWEQAKFPDAWKPYFRVELTRHKRLWHPSYVFAHRGLFELTIKPQIVTELRVPDLEVEARIRELNQWLAQRDLLHRIDWLLGVSRYQWADDNRTRIHERLAVQEMRQAKLHCPEVDLGSVTCRAQISLQHSFAPVAQGRGSRLKTGPVPVRSRPGASLYFVCFMEREPDQRAGTPC